MKPVASVVALFCEDAREEKSGGMTLLGVFPDNMKVPMIPGRFGKLTVYVRASFDPNSLPETIHFRMTLPDDQEVAFDDIDPTAHLEEIQDAVQKGAPLFGVIMTAETMGLPIMKAGRIVVLARIGNGEEFPVGALNVQPDPAAATFSTVQLRPSAQSPSAAPAKAP